MYTATQVQILDETDCISHSTNTLGNGMNPIILPPAMFKFKPVKLCLKIDLVSYPARAEGLVNMIKYASFLNRTIGLIDGTLMSTTTPGQSGSE